MLQLLNFGEVDSNKNFQRRYSMLEKDFSHIVLVHYLELTDCANISGSTPKDLFEDVAEGLEQQYIESTIWYLQHGKTLEDGLVRIVNDDSVKEVLEIIKVVNVIHVYILHFPDFAHVEEEVLLLPAPGDDQKEDNDDATDNVQPNVTEESVGADGAAANVAEEGVSVKTHDGGAVTDDGVRVESDDDEEDHIIDVLELTDNEDEETLQARKNVKFFNNIEDSIEKDLKPPIVDVKYFDAHTTASSSARGPNGQHLDEVDEIGSDEEDSYLSTSDDEASEAKHGKRRRATHKVYQEPGDDETPNIRLGMMFINKQQFRDVICLAMDKPTESWMVKTFASEHTCHWLLKKNKRCNSTIAAKHLVRHRGFTALYMRRTDIYNVIRKELSVELSNHQLKKVKEKIGKAFEGDCKIEYGKLWDYAAELRLKNPATTIIISASRPTTDLNPVFLRIYICFSAMKLGFVAGCRHVIGLNGALLKRAFKGVLLVAVSRDANNQMYPLAWAAVEDAEHRTCARHKYANFRKNNRGKELKVAFWRCVKANTEHDINRALTELRHIEPSAVPAIMSTHPRHAVTVINHRQENNEDYVAHWYNKHMFMASYEYEVPIIKGINQWKETKMPPMQPPNPRKMSGRQKKKRQPEEWEGKTSIGRKGRLMTCQKCFKRGHNSRSCKGVPPNIQEQNEDQATPQEEQPQGVDENIGANVENPMSQVEDPLSHVLNKAPTPNRFSQTARRKQEVCEGSSKNAQPRKRAKKNCATTTTGPSQSQAATTSVAKDKGKQLKKPRQPKKKP
ncbi:hypothetical protein SLEP1_g14844 [Rubroshorea leprosula]|uniref:Transposase n=1 Tax=Rubroshorea leprosula TaxID=152421 RepID=A0AAV5IKI6_9ROSI|nr:hypothetical protein SLEP1_g14844 [Rubroshorea leprosula]